MATQYQSIDPKLVAKNKKQPVPMVSTTQAPVLQSSEVRSQQPQPLSTNINPMQGVWTIPWVWLKPVNQPIQSAQENFTPAPSIPTQVPTPEKLPETWATDYKAIATPQEKESFSKMLDDWLTPERASAALKFAIDKRLQDKPSMLSQAVDLYQNTPWVVERVPWAVIGWLKWLAEWTYKWVTEWFDKTKENIWKWKNILWEVISYLGNDIVGWLVSWATEWIVKWATTEIEKQKAKEVAVKLAPVIAPMVDKITEAYNKNTSEWEQDLMRYVWGLLNIIPAYTEWKALLKWWKTAVTEIASLAKSSVPKMLESATTTAQKVKQWAVATAGTVSKVPEQVASLPWKAIAKTKEALESSVDDITKKAIKEGKITPEYFENARRTVETSTKDINAPWGFDQLANDIEHEVNRTVRKPMKAIGKQIGEIRDTMKNRWVDLKVDSKPALQELDNILANDYNAVVTKKWDVLPKSWWLHKLTLDDETVLLDLRKELTKVQDANDIDIVFKNANDKYDKLVKAQVWWKANKQLLRRISKIREKLETQLDDVIWSEYKGLRTKYKKFLDLDERFTNLFQRSKPWVTNDEYTTISRIKKLFSPDKWAVLDDFKLLKDVTGRDFASEAQVYKFLAEQYGDEKSLSLLQLVKEVWLKPRSISGKVDAAIWWAFDRAWNKIVWTPIEVAKRIVAKAKNVPEIKVPFQVKDITQVIEQINKNADIKSKAQAVEAITKKLKTPAVKSEYNMDFLKRPVPKKK